MLKEFLVPSIRQFVQVDSAMCTFFLNELRSLEAENKLSGLSADSRHKIWGGRRGSCECPCKCTCTCKCKVFG